MLRSNSVFHRHVQAQWSFDAPERHVSVAKLSDKVKTLLSQKTRHRPFKGPVARCCFWTMLFGWKYSTKTILVIKWLWLVIDLNSDRCSMICLRSIVSFYMLLYFCSHLWKSKKIMENFNMIVSYTNMILKYPTYWTHLPKVYNNSQLWLLTILCSATSQIFIIKDENKATNVLFYSDFAWWKYFKRVSISAFAK